MLRLEAAMDVVKVMAMKNNNVRYINAFLINLIKIPPLATTILFTFLLTSTP
jgi:hypothetical protein